MDKNIAQEVSQKNKSYFYKLADQAYNVMRRGGFVGGEWSGHFTSENRPQDYIYILISGNDVFHGDIEFEVGLVRDNILYEMQQGIYDVEGEGSDFYKSLSDIFDIIYASIDKYTEQNFVAVFSEHPNEEYKMFSSYIPSNDPSVLPLDEHYKALGANGFDRYFKMFEEDGTGTFGILDYDGSKMIDLKNDLNEKYEESPQYFDAEDMLESYESYVDDMTSQLDAALKELQEVKGQLAKAQENPAKWFASRMAGMVENRLHKVQDHLSVIMDRFRNTVLEHAAGHGRGTEKATLQEETRAPKASGERPARKREEKPSVLKALQKAKGITDGHGKQADGQSREVGQHQPKTKDGVVL